MKSDEYLKGVLTTENVNFLEIAKRMDLLSNIRLLHAATGISTEAGEFVDCIKKHVFYGKEPDRTNLFEELGDLLWYIGIALDAIGESFESCMEANNAKLKARYGEKYTDEKAIERDLAEEEKVLEEKIND